MKNLEPLEAQIIARLGIALAKRLTEYFPPVDEIEDVLDCDIEIRRMADELLPEVAR